MGIPLDHSCFPLFPAAKIISRLDTEMSYPGSPSSSYDPGYFYCRNHENLLFFMLCFFSAFCIQSQRDLKKLTPSAPGSKGLMYSGSRKRKAYAPKSYLYPSFPGHAARQEPSGPYFFFRSGHLLQHHFCLPVLPQVFTDHCRKKMILLF